MISAGARAWIFYVLMNVLIVALVWVAADRIGLLWIVPIMLSINLLILTYGQLLDFSKLDAEKVSGFDRWGLYKILQPAVEKLGLPKVPDVYIMPVDAPQALSYARTLNSARIYLSEGFLERLSGDERAAIIVQQLVALKLQAGVGFYFLAAMTDLLFRVGRIFDVSFGWIFGWRPQLSTWPIAPIVKLLQKMFLPRDIYLEIDRQTAEIIGSPEVLAKAIWKLDSYSRTNPLPNHLFVWSHMCVVSPLLEKRPILWLKTQPQMKSRIKNLVGYFPL